MWVNFLDIQWGVTAQASNTCSLRFTFSFEEKTCCCFELSMSSIYIVRGLRGTLFTVPWLHPYMHGLALQKIDQQGCIQHTSLPAAGGAQQKHISGQR